MQKRRKAIPNAEENVSVAAREKELVTCYGRRWNSYFWNTKTDETTYEDLQHIYNANKLSNTSTILRLKQQKRKLTL